MIGRRESGHEAVVIGAGAGGLTVALGLAAFGRRVALVEAGPVGGDCANAGCIPSKRLIHLSRLRGGREHGPTIFADVRATRDRVQRNERRALLEHPRIDLIEGRARFASRRAVHVTAPDGERTLRAPNIVIATGSRARRVEIPGLPAERLLTTETLFEIDSAPAHLAIVGAGAIGLEMAGAFSRLGSRVTLIDTAGRVLPAAIPEASATMETTLREEGIDIRLRADVRGYDERDRALTIGTPRGDARIPSVDAVLVAAGRDPNTDTLGIETLGIAAGRGGIAVDGWGRTSKRGIWAVGDVAAGSHQTHAANALGRRIVQRIALPWLPPLGRPPLIPSAVFCEPEVAWVGPSPSELSRDPDPRLVTRIRVDVADTDRGLTDGVRHGFVAIDAVRLTGRILSATAVGPSASELIALITMAMARGVTLMRLSRLVYAYPTFVGAIGQAADAFAGGTLTGLRRDAATYARHRIGGVGRRRTP